MTVKERLHALVEVLDDSDAEFALSYLAHFVAPMDGSDEPGLDEDTRVEATDPQEILRLAKPITADDPLWDIVGMADSGPNGPTDVSRNKYKYLAEAYANLHEE